MSEVFLLVMLIFAPILALIVLALAVLNALVAFVLVRIQLDKSLALRREMGLFAGVGTLILGNNDMLRSTSADDHFFAALERLSGPDAGDPTRIRRVRARQFVNVKFFHHCCQCRCAYFWGGDCN